MTIALEHEPGASPPPAAGPVLIGRVSRIQPALRSTIKKRDVAESARLQRMSRERAKLFDRDRLDVRGRAHFYSLAARAMRQILGGAAKRGGDRRPVTLDSGALPAEARGDLLAVDEALERLAELSDRLFRVVECKFFGGMTEGEIALALNVSDRTIRNDWRKARAWLARELAQDR